MNTKADKANNADQSRAVANRDSRQLKTGDAAFAFVDNSPETIAQQKLQVAINTSPRMAAQRKQLEGMFGAPVQRQDMLDEEALQMKAEPGVLQRQGMLKGELQMKADPVENRTGMPDKLKTGVENLSGMDMSDVRVHYNSSKPAQLNALAYTQGTKIHVAPGQEQHLPHEAWHAAQQKQGRVQPTMKLNGTNINDDSGLEREADVMGAKSSRKEKNKNQLVANEISQKQSGGESTFQFVDNRPEAAAQQKLQEMANTGSHVNIFLSSPIQRKKGDPDDPHRARESKPVWLPEVTDEVIVPGLAGCAGMKVNVFQSRKDRKRLVASVVLHSEGDVTRSLAAANEINQNIKNKGDGINISVEIFVMYNGKYEPAHSDHAPVLNAIKQDFDTIPIPIKITTAVVKSTSPFIDINMTGTEEDILYRYRKKLRVESSPEVQDYRRSKFARNKRAYIGNGADSRQIDDWSHRWAHTESIAEVDQLIREANQQRARASRRRPCYLTTACVEYAGLGDDCYELSMLRNFRDTYMGSLEEGSNMVQEYYSVAPGIVESIEKSEQKAQIYAEILRIVRQCAVEIENGVMDNVLSLYKVMVKRLKDHDYETEFQNSDENMLTET